MLRRFASKGLVDSHVPSPDQWRVGVLAEPGATFFYISAHVQASFRDQLYLTELWLLPSGRLAYCSCNCTGGQHGCHHALSLFVRLDFAVRIPGPNNLAAQAIRHMLSLDRPTAEYRALVVAFYELAGCDLSFALAPVSTQRPRLRDNFSGTKMHLPASRLQFESSGSQLKYAYRDALGAAILS
jgi:hypothetical protein